MGGMEPTKTVRRRGGRLGSNSSTKGSGEPALSLGSGAGGGESSTDTGVAPPRPLDQECARLITEITSFIERECLEEEGLYRLSGVRSKFSRIVRQFLDGQPVHWADEELVGDESARLEALRAVVQALPELNFTVARDLFAHLRLVATRADVNKMRASNLGVVFGPTLLRNAGGSINAIRDIKYQNVVVDSLIC
eukprot:UC1_evm1s562